MIIVGTVTVNDIDTITENVVSYYASLSSTTYGVFDSGYKYMYDRFNDTFRYVPLNGDIAGTCARTDLQQFPWFSPAGTSRGSILNAVKLAYNPGRKQRDVLYSNRVNPVIFSLEQESSSSVIRLDSVNLLHSIESTFAVCSSIWKMQSLLPLRTSSSSSTMRSQELTS